ncbi:hypothetical protein F4809DRAFT_549309 [Biscogniauxia mediterranea]|nr:hypothetical protein F4809DRAFT_549309 [Biscogniauxia mediterranea]
MHMSLQSSLMAFLAAGSAMAHMNMKDPAPLAYKGNPNAKEPNIDYSITSPLEASQFPCKGWLKLIGTDEGASVKTYAPGEQSTMTVEGGASHNGGSCQLSLSYDQKTFTVIKSFIGDCPTSSGGTFDFTIPEDAPEGDNVVFSWSWVNKTGNREFYQSCAVVTIKGSSSKHKRSSSTADKRATVAWADRPKMFEANLGGEYCTKEGVDTVYPEPGPDVENNASSPGPAIICSTGADAPEGSDSGSGSGSGSGSSSSYSATTQSPTSTSMYVTSPLSSSTSAHLVSSTASSITDTTSSASASDVLTVIPISELTSSSSTGGVFLTTAEPAPTTLSTATSPPATSASATSAPVSSVQASSSSAAAGNQGTATSSSAPSSTGSVSGQQTGACSNEGAWNCIDGSSFQRCASGQWSAVISMASGTKCSTGVSDNLQMRRRRDRVRRRGFSAWDW